MPLVRLTYPRGALAPAQKRQIAGALTEIVLDAEKVAHSYNYYFTQFGSHVILTALKLKSLVLIPALAQPATA